MVRRPSVVRRSQCSDIFCSETALPIEVKFYVEPPWVGAKKGEVCLRHPGHIINMAAKPIYGNKPSKKLLLWNQWTDFHETLYVALGTLAHHSLFK